MTVLLCTKCNFEIKFKNNKAICSNGHEFKKIGNIVDLDPEISEQIKDEEKHFDDVSTKGKKLHPDPYYAKKITSDIISNLENLVKKYCKLNSKNLVISEIGCGPGTGISYLKHLNLNSDYYGIDISLESMKKLKSFPKEMNVCFIRSDCNKLNFLKHGSFDLILCFSTLHHLDVEKIFEQVYKLLSPGGLFILREPSSKNPFANFARKLIPDYNTENESPLLPDNLQTFYPTTCV